MQPNPPPSRLQVKAHRATGGVLVRLSGVVDETLDRVALVDGYEGVVVFDLDKLTQVTSFGVREWIAALQQLAHSPLFFVKCRPALVSQFNMVRGFSGHGRVVSIYLPYVCPSCNASFDELLDLRTQHDVVETYQPKPVPCPKCRAPAEFDDIPESYLSYVARQPRPQTPPAFETIVSAADSGSLGTLRIEKEVSGNLTGLWLNGTLDGRDYLKRVADGIEGSLLLSLEGVTGYLPEGLDRIASFVARVNVPTTLTAIPIELADRIARMPELASKDYGVRTVVAEYACPDHGTSQVSLSVAAFKHQEPLVLCSLCRRPMAPRFPPAMLESMRTIPAAKPNTDEAALLQSRSMSHAEPTGLKTPTTGQFVPGAVVMGRYRFERMLGAGGMAEVFLARQTSIGGFEKLVVIKRILPGLAMESTFVDMFLYEARVAARLVHPNVVQIFDVGRDAGQHFIVMEYVNGWDLAAVLRGAARTGSLMPVSVGLSLIADVARGLHAAHTSLDVKGALSPIVHRDVSPHNILVGRDGVAKITDFGIAKAADALSATPTSMIKGKTAYLAPEVVMSAGTGDLQPSRDIFALGIVLYQVLTGTNPFRRENDVATVSAILQDTPPLVCAVRPEVPLEVALLVSRLLEKDPSQRISTAAEAANELQALQRGLEAAAPQPSAAEWLKNLEALVADAPPMRRKELEVRVIDMTDKT